MRAGPALKKFSKIYIVEVNNESVIKGHRIFHRRFTIDMS